VPMLVSLFPWSACVSYCAQEDTRRNTEKKNPCGEPLVHHLLPRSRSHGSFQLCAHNLTQWIAAVWLECEMARPKCKLDVFVCVNDLDKLQLVRMRLTLLYPFVTCIAQHRATQSAWVSDGWKNKARDLTTRQSRSILSRATRNTHDRTKSVSCVLCILLCGATHAVPPCKEKGLLYSPPKNNPRTIGDTTCLCGLSETGLNQVWQCCSLLVFGRHKKAGLLCLFDGRNWPLPWENPAQMGHCVCRKTLAHQRSWSLLSHEHTLVSAGIWPLSCKPVSQRE